MNNKPLIYLFLVLIITYLSLVFNTPTDPEVLKRYMISQERARLLNLTIVIPLIIVWFTALYSFIRFRRYAEIIKDTKEGKPFRRISSGLGVLAFNLPVGAVLSSYVNRLAVIHPDQVVEATIIKNYVGLFMAVIGLLLIADGAAKLLATIKTKHAKTYPRYTLLVVIALSSLFTWLITTRAFSDEHGDKAFYLPNWLLLLTIALPYLYVWCKGLYAAYQLNFYRHQVNGVIYRKAIKYFSRGVIGIISISILLQFLAALSARFQRLNLTPILIIVYVLVLLYAIAYGWTAYGAKKLKQIEEV